MCMCVRESESKCHGRTKVGIQDESTDLVAGFRNQVSSCRSERIILPLVGALFSLCL